MKRPLVDSLAATARRRPNRTDVPLVGAGSHPETAGMGETAEQGDEVFHVIDRLAAVFPSLAREHIARVVDEEYERLHGARVQTFIPVLVEHAATDRLRAEAPAVMPAAEEVGGTAAIIEPGLDPMEVQRRRQQPGGPLLGNSGGG